MLVTASGQTPEVIATDPGVMWIFSGSRFHSPWGRVIDEKLFGVRPRPLAELARKARQAALVLHVKKELRRAIRVGGDDHLFGGVRVTVEMRRPLRPTRMTRMHLEPAVPRAGQARTPRAAHESRRRAFPPGTDSSWSACSWHCGRSRSCSCRMRCIQCAAARHRRSTDLQPRRPGCRSRHLPGPC